MVYNGCADTSGFCVKVVSKLYSSSALRLLRRYVKYGPSMSPGPPVVGRIKSFCEKVRLAYLFSIQVSILAN